MKAFMIGVSTAAHQVEGDNKNSDFWKIENMKNTRFEEPSLKSVDHYNRYREDIDLIKNAGLNAYRFGIEWARIEPIKGEYSIEEINHYREVLKYCINNEITPIVTMHHFSSPKWLISENGWENEKVIEWFTNYCEFVIKELGEYLEYICTINEANMGLQIANKIAKLTANKEGQIQVGLSLKRLNDEDEKRELLEVFGVDKANTFLAPRSKESDEIVFKAHLSARKAMKKIKSDLKVGITLSLHDFQSVDGGEDNALKEWDIEFGHYIQYIKGDDFFGLQNYTRRVYNADGIVEHPLDEKKKTQMGYEYYPQALSNVIRKVSQSIDIPIIITENGIATSDDKERQEFIKEALDGVKKCIEDDINILGYMHWSLLDNFEWQKGYKYTFGLVEVDRKTFKRIPKASLNYLGTFKRYFN